MVMVKSRETFSLHALLIGIDYYLPNELPNGLCKSLTGCVRDILQMDEFLRNDLGVPAERILKLTSPQSHDNVPLETPEEWPTYQNIVNAFCELETLTEAGDQVFIHYSGHSCRALTTEVFCDIKWPDGIDHVLIPMDFSISEARYLRDVELQYLLQKLVDKEVFITVVLDCCHGGGFTRGMKLDLQSCTVITACSSSESAFESTFDANVNHGALTYWLIDSLKRTRQGFTYKMLHDRLLAKVLGQFAYQTPQLQGNGNREVFGVVERPIQNGVTVIHVQSGEITLNAGRAHGLSQGSQFSVFPLFEADISYVDNRVAVVEIIETEATISKARILSCLHSEAIEPGAQAVLVDPGKELRRCARLTTEINGATEASLAALEEVEQLFAQTRSGFVALATNDDVADYLVTVSMDGEFIVYDGLGERILNLKPSLFIKDSTAPYQLLRRLVHVTRYFHVRDLYNNDPSSMLKGRLLTEILPEGTSPEEMRGARILTTDEINVNDGESVRLRVRNNSSEILNIAALELRADWAIKQIYPKDTRAFEPLDPNQEVVLSLPMSLPAQVESGRQIIKVFGTLGTTSFRWLELAALDYLENENCPSLFTRFLNRLHKTERAGSHTVPITAGKSAVRGARVIVSSTDWVVQALRIQIQSDVRA